MIKVQSTKTHTSYWFNNAPVNVSVIDAELVLVEEKLLTIPSIQVNGKIVKPILISRTEKIEKGDAYYNIPSSRIYLHTYDVFRDKHSANNVKILALPEHFSPQQLQNIVEGKLKEGKCLVECEQGEEIKVTETDSKGKAEKWNHLKATYIKLNPHITIYTVEEKIYTREEVIKEGNKLADHIQQLIRNTFGCDYLYNELKVKSKEWFEQNVK